MAEPRSEDQALPPKNPALVLRVGIIAFVRDIVELAPKIVMGAITLSVRINKEKK
jgi:hypothetical protein